MTTEDVFDLLDHAVEPDPWECDGDWEYRAMHWRPHVAVGSSAVASGSGSAVDAG